MILRETFEAHVFSFVSRVFAFSPVKCFFCHGTDPETHEEAPRLDIRADALAGKAFIPGNPEKSRLIQLINATDEDDLMPPPESHKSLTHKEKRPRNFFSVKSSD
jgi:hypothetical protein